MRTPAPQSQPPVEAGPLWGLLLVLAEIAERLSREQAQEPSASKGGDADARSPKNP